MKDERQGLGLEHDAGEMQRQFDQKFAAAATAGSVDYDDYVALRAGGRSYAVRVVELARIEFVSRIVTVPGSNPWLLGLGNIKGKLIPVFSLELIVGIGEASTKKNWIVLEKDESFALAFERMEGYLRLPRNDLVSQNSREINATLVRMSVLHEGVLRPIVHLPSVSSAIRERLSMPTTA